MSTSLVRERTNAGLAAARARGRGGGRSRKRSTNEKGALARRLSEDPDHSFDDSGSTPGIAHSTLDHSGRRGQEDIETLLAAIDAARLRLILRVQISKRQTSWTHDCLMADFSFYMRLPRPLAETLQALSYYEQALGIHKEVGNRAMEGTTLHNIGILCFERDHLEVGLACILLALRIFEKVQSPSDCDDEQQVLDSLHEEVGEEQFAILLAKVEPQAHQIVEQALREGL